MSIPVVKVPTFVMTLPLSGEEITYRPFLVKEEKLLILANEGNIIKDITDAVVRLVEDCTFSVMKSSVYSMFDIQYAFLQIRGKSISEVIDFYLICDSCQHKTETTVRVDQFAFRHTEGHSKVVEISSGIKINMRYPSFEKYGMLYDNGEDGAVFDVVASCVESIVSDDEVFKNDSKDALLEVREYLDNMTPEQFAKLESFFTTMPVLEHVITYKCGGCETENTVVIDGVRNFFE